MPAFHSSIETASKSGCRNIFSHTVSGRLLIRLSISLPTQQPDLRTSSSTTLDISTHHLENKQSKQTVCKDKVVCHRAFQHIPIFYLPTPTCHIPKRERSRTVQLQPLAESHTISFSLPLPPCLLDSWSPLSSLLILLLAGGDIPPSWRFRAEVQMKPATTNSMKQ